VKSKKKLSTKKKKCPALSREGLVKGLSFSVIIPNFNGVAFLSNCLVSLTKAIKNCPQSKFEIIIIDNASVDDSVNLAKKFFIKHKIQNLTSNILHLNTNTGFAFAVNQGIKISKYPYSCVCNNDLKIEPNWFNIISNNIVFTQNNPKIATYFGTVLSYDGTKFESQGLDFHYSGKCNNISNGKNFNKNAFLKANKLLTNRLIWGAPAALIIYKKEIIQKIGMFDSDFFAYEEDVDLSLRLYNFGYQTLYIPQAICYHLGGATSKKMGNFRHKMDAKNWIYIIIKNYSGKQILKNLFPIIEQRLRNLSGLIKNTPIRKLPKNIFTTYGEVFSNLSKMLQKRHHIQKMLKFHKF
jgi:GT2 family glycosyltransferase